MELLQSLFKVRGSLNKKTSVIIGLIGLFFIILVWHIVSVTELISSSILPTPWSVITSVKELHYDDFIIRNALYSIKLNFLGYISAALIAIPLGFLIGLFPIVRALVSKYIDAMRFVPIAACTGLFIGWFGLGDFMKTMFLGFGIFVYLLPVVVERVDQVPEVLDQTARTMGANVWQRIKTIFIPSAMSAIITDIRVLVAISWTYITIAEMMNMTGGIGAMTYSSYREGRIDKVFAVLVIIVLIGVVQDLMFRVIEKTAFPHKFALKK